VKFWVRLVGGRCWKAEQGAGNSFRLDLRLPSSSWVARDCAVTVCYWVCTSSLQWMTGASPGGWDAARPPGLDNGAVGSAGNLVNSACRGVSSGKGMRERIEALKSIRWHAEFDRLKVSFWGFWVCYSVRGTVQHPWRLARRPQSTPDLPLFPGLPTLRASQCWSCTTAQ
jgi:hypothetical protein